MANVTAGSFATVGVEDQVTAYEPDATTVEAVISSTAYVALAKLANGIFGGVNEDTGLTIWLTNLGEHATGTMGTGSNVYVTASDDSFYALQIDTGVWTLRQFDQDGLQQDLWDGVAGLPSTASELCGGIGVNAAGTTLYYTGAGTPSDPTKVFSFTLASDTDNGALITRALFAGGPILVLPDGTLLVAWFDIATATTFDVKHYSALGAVLHTYSNIWGPMALNLARTSTSFWINDTVSGNLMEIQVSSGTALQTLTSAWDVPASFIVLDEFITPEGTTRYSRALRRFPLPFSQNKQIDISRIEFLIQGGVGLLPVQQGDDPQMMVRFSRDGGKTWGPETWVSMGVMGEYGYRSYINRLGTGRNWVCEVAVSDPVFIGFITCYVDAEEGLS